MAFSTAYRPCALDQATRKSLSTTAKTTTTGGPILTDSQFLTLIGTIYIAHFTGKLWNGIVGSIILIIASLKGIGWL